MRAEEYIARFTKALASRKDVLRETYSLHYQAGDFLGMKLRSKDITPDDKIIMITAGIHGEEVAGPLALLSYIHKIIDLVHGHGYKLIIYPLTNPSAFDQGKRFNIDNDEGDCGNNDFMRYELANGEIVDDLGADNTYAKRYRSSDPQFHAHLPVENAMMHTLIKKDPLTQVVAHLDLHQDYITPVSKPYAYYYAFNDQYVPIVKEIRKHIAMLANTSITAGQHGSTPSDANGCIIRYDGTISDLFFRLGAKHAITVETTGNTPLAIAKRINRIRIKGIVLLLDHEASC